MSVSGKSNRSSALEGEIRRVVVRRAGTAQTPRDLASDTRQAIVTKFSGPTNTTGSRVIASCEAKRIMVPWDHALNPDQNHAAAALQLMRQLGWSDKNDLVMGGTRDGYVFVQVPRAG